MIKTGLVSITFRKLSVDEIIRLVSEAGLDSIEWGGDVHVPHGNISAARNAKRLCDSSGLEVASYGSYYKAGSGPKQELSFSSILDTALELDAGTIRVWAGEKNREDADPEYQSMVIDDLLRIADLAKESGPSISIEFHGGTLTNTNDSAIQLIKELSHPNIRLYWQPPVGRDEKYCMDGLERISDSVSNLHVFHWDVLDGRIQRLPLADGEISWLKYLSIFKRTEKTRHALIEFVKDDAPENLISDASALKSWVQKINQPH